MGQVQAEPIWSQWSDEALLKLRFCDLKLNLARSGLRRHWNEIVRELDERGIPFRPHMWCAEEWFTPSGVPGIGVPFYLAHPRLLRLERKFMLEAEGERSEHCLKILRHEFGHAIENAYRLHRRRKRQRIFGRSTQKYPDFYFPKPHSKRYVRHLDSWYAQSHPDEDFAETFAVWLDPGSEWKERYKGWPALKKIEYMNELMGELAGKSPLVKTRQRVDPISNLTKTLAEHYEQKRRRFGLDEPFYYDQDLKRLFSNDPSHQRNMTAAAFLRKIRRVARRQVAHWTGQYQYTIDSVIGEMIERCQELRLRIKSDAEQTKVDFTVLLTVQTMDYLHNGRHRVTL